ncbi:MAG: hypothetical protein HY465_01155 [Deltaproteobacteria bacterium]|nr:hypothetical protein [Deltaproteobacteria bacterium]
MTTWIRALASLLGVTLSVFVVYCGGGQVSSEAVDSTDGSGVTTESETPASEATGTSTAEDVFGAITVVMNEENQASISVKSLEVVNVDRDPEKDVSATSGGTSCAEGDIPTVFGSSYLLSGSSGGTCSSAVENGGGGLFSLVIDCDNYDPGNGCVYNGVLGGDADASAGSISFGSEGLTATCGEEVYTYAINVTASGGAFPLTLEGCIALDDAIFTVSGELDVETSDDDSQTQVQSSGTCGDNICSPLETVGSCASDCTFSGVDFSGSYLLASACTAETRTDNYTGSSNGPYSSLTSTFAFTFSNASLCEATSDGSICTSCTWTGGNPGETTILTAVCGGCTMTLTEQ